MALEHDYLPSKRTFMSRWIMNPITRESPMTPKIRCYLSQQWMAIAKGTLKSLLNEKWPGVVPAKLRAKSAVEKRLEKETLTIILEQQSTNAPSIHLPAEREKRKPRLFTVFEKQKYRKLKK